MFILIGIVALLTGVAFLPIDTTPMASDPHPAATYPEAITRYQAMQAAERDSVMADGASVMLVHGHRTTHAILLVHGLTNSPRQFRELAQQFYDSGYNVIVPRMPQHGLASGDVGVLASLTAEKYRAFADQGVDIAHGLGDSISVLGLSAGGNVAAWIAQRRADVSRVVVVAPALELARIPRLLRSPTMKIVERVPNMTFHQAPDTLRPHAYFGVSTRGVGETLRFAASVLADAADRAPLVPSLTLVLNAHDHTIDAETAMQLSRDWTARSGRETTVYVFDDRFALPHDAVDASQKCGMTELVYPVLMALVQGRTPPAAPAIPPHCAPVP